MKTLKLSSKDKEALNNVLLTASLDNWERMRKCAPGTLWHEMAREENEFIKRWEKNLK